MWKSDLFVDSSTANQLFSQIESHKLSFRNTVLDFVKNDMGEFTSNGNIGFEKGLSITYATFDF